MGLNEMTSELIKTEKFGYTDKRRMPCEDTEHRGHRHTKKMQRDDIGRDWNHVLGAKEHQRLPATTRRERRERIHPRPSEEAWPCW